MMGGKRDESLIKIVDDLEYPRFTYSPKQIKDIYIKLKPKLNEDEVKRDIIIYGTKGYINE